MRTLALTIAVTAMAGCSMTPHYVRPEAPVPSSWPVGDAYLAQSEASLPALPWRQQFIDPRLQALIAQSLANNRDLRSAVANIAAARAQYRIQRADLLPEIDATGRYSYSDGGTNTLSNGSGNTGGTTGGATGGTGRNGSSRNGFTADVGTTAFEIDLFGRIRSLSQAALDRYFATEAAARATRLTLVGDVAEAWLTYAADRSLLSIAQNTAASAERSVSLTRARLAGGIAPRTDVRQAEQILSTAQADVAQQKTAVAQDANALQLLVGAPIDTALLPGSIESVSGAVVAVPAGLDSGILLRRPDVVQSEYQLRATNAEIGAARAALFPRISLTGLLGFASTALSSLFASGSFNYSVAPSVSYPIFRAGAGIAGVRYSEAQRDAALAAYEKSIQTAFREVSDALARQGTIADQLRANRRAQDAAADTAMLTDARYRGGVDTYLASLDAQRSLYAAQRTFVATQLVGVTNRVQLYRAIGGDSTLEVTADGPRPVSASGQSRTDEPLPVANRAP